MRDAGIGIDAAFLPHVFNRFTQGDGSTVRRHGGLGLGLAIAKGFSDAFGIGLEAATHPEGGAVFTLRFLPELIVAVVPGD